MPDFTLPMVGMLVGALVAAVVMYCSAPCAIRVRWRGPLWSLAVGAGVFAGGTVADSWTWPPLEDRARFFALLLPLTFVLETLATRVKGSGICWAIRLTLSLAAAPILLFDSVYLTDAGGAGSALWPMPQAVAILAAIGCLLAILWYVMSALEARSSTCTIHDLLALDSLAAGLAVMLSGYFRAGVLGLTLATSISGAAMASRFLRLPAQNLSSVGMSTIGLYGVILLGAFFAALPAELAAVLLLAPLAAWIVELPRLCLLPPRWRTLARVACVAVPLLVAVTIAQARFAAASAARSTKP